MANKKDLKLPLDETNFSTSAAANYSQSFQTLAQTEVAVYHEKYYIGNAVLCKLQIS
jgi:hypothetical protein